MKNTTKALVGLAALIMSTGCATQQKKETPLQTQTIPVQTLPLNERVFHQLQPEYQELVLTKYQGNLENIPVYHPCMPYLQSTIEVANVVEQYLQGILPVNGSRK